MDDETFDFFDSEPTRSENPQTSSNQQRSVTEISRQSPNTIENIPDKIPKRIKAVVPSVSPSSVTESDSDSDHDREFERKLRKPNNAEEEHHAGMKLKTEDGRRNPTLRKSDEPDSDSDSQTSMYSSETNSDVTDVSPLQTPAYTPQSKKYVSRELEEYTAYSRKPPTPKRPSSATRDSATSTSKRIQGIIDDKGGAINMEVLMEAMMELGADSSRDHEEGAKDHHVRFDTPQREGHNYSFSMEKARAIDRENQRLLHKLMKYEQGAKAIKRPSPSKVKKPPPQMTPSAVNRKRELERIERENYVSFIH